MATDSSNGVISSRGGLDTEAMAPTVFAPGEDKLTEQELRALSPQEMIWRHRSVAGLSEALIMMVDDEQLNIEMTQAFLIDAGYKHFVHTDLPEQAMAMLRKERPGVLLLDLSMPKVSGLEILAEMRDDPLTRHIPVIVLTSSIDPQVKLKALALGAMDFLSKPVDPSELGLRIRNTLAASAYRDYLGHHDALTGLPNKLRYRKEAAALLGQARADAHSGAFLHVGVDGLGRVNDALGRVVGDQLLQRIAKRLASCVQTEAGGELSSEHASPTLYRFDGDEFAVLIPYMDGIHSAAAFINRILEDATVSFQRPGAPEVFVTCSVGVSVFPTDGSDADVLMRNAGLALRHAKQAGPHRYEFFSPRFTEQAQTRLDLGAELRHAISRDQIELLFKPRVELSTGRVAAAQALVRWNHPSGRIIEGDELMDLAGTSEMDVALTEWVFEQVHKHSRTWKAANLQAVPVAVAASVAQIQLRDLGYLAQNEVAQRDAAAIAALRKRGMRFSLDRFGASASVAQLRKLQVDEIKVDASFMRELEKDAAIQAMMLGMGDLAHRLKLTYVATGVDTAQQVAFLKKNRWDQAQGLFFGAPASGINFASRWLARVGKPTRIAGADGGPQSV
jgi:diguanylate cyclase (GGDEF)-like protein